MELTITLGGITRRYMVEANDIYNGSWQEVLEDMLDTVEKTS